ncbi:MAG: alpha-2-macroglobulin family protein [Prochlorothrix sp.]|nr:alpha-2-macroglobulin family protein [Prochlorothrix sp.]
MAHFPVPAPLRRVLRRLSRQCRSMWFPGTTPQKFFKGVSFQLLFALGLGLSLLFSACQGGDSGSQGKNPLTPAAISQELLPFVDALPDPFVPDWIAGISPQGQVESLAQVRIRFQDPIVPLEQLDSENQQEILSHFRLDPPLPGQFRLLTPRMVGFQGERALPQATRLQVTLTAGLEDLSGHRLDQDLAWTFETAPIDMLSLPTTDVEDDWQEPEYLDQEPRLSLTANAPVTLKSLQEKTRFEDDQGQSVAVQVVLDEETVEQSQNWASAQYDPSQVTWRYWITPDQPLALGTRYRLAIAPGLEPAGGNLVSTETFSSGVETYGPLTFLGMGSFGEPDGFWAAGRFSEGGPELRFNNGLDRDSIAENVTIDPAPVDDRLLIQAYEGDSRFRLNPWALEPQQRYRITLGAGLADQYGQTLGKAVNLTYQAGDAVPDLWAPRGLTIFPADREIGLEIDSINLPDGYQSVFRTLSPQDVINLDPDYPSDKATDLFPPQAEWPRVTPDAAPNETTKTVINLQERLGGTSGALAYGVRGKTYQYTEDNGLQWQEPEFYGVVQLTNLGVFAQWFPQSGRVRVHRLDTGQPVGDVEVGVYVADRSAPLDQVPTACATARTDARGSVDFSQDQIQGCYQAAALLNDYEWEGPSLVVIAQQGDDWAFTHTFPYSGSYGFGAYTRWDGGQILPLGVIFSDRELYQPGETAWFTVTTQKLEQGHLGIDSQPYRITVTQPDGETFDLGTRSANAYGTLSLSWDLPPDQPLGFYQIQAEPARNPNQRIPALYSEFQVAEFRPPNFAVDLNLDRTLAQAGETLTASVDGRYLFGSPLQGGQVNYWVTRRSLEDFTPAGWDGFKFGRRWFWPEDPPLISSEVLQTEASLDDRGQGRQSIPIAEDLPFAMTYRVDAEVQDVSNLGVSASQTFTALPSDRLIGLKHQFVGTAQQDFEVEVIVTDGAGAVQTGEAVTVTLEQMDYSFARRLLAGSISDRNQVSYTPVAEAEVRSASTPQTVTLQAPEPGSYRIRANFSRNLGKTEATVSDSQVWMTGSGSVFWGNRDNQQLQITLDRDSYAVGDTATALIQSPYEAGELYVSVVRDRPLWQQVIPVQGSAPQIQFEVTPEMLPNAALEAVIVRQGQGLQGSDADQLENLVRIGLEPFEVDRSDQYLQVAVTPRQDILQPGSQQTLDIALTDGQGQPQAGQVTLMVVNEAVLQLTGYRPPDLVETVYGDQPIATRFNDNRFDVVLEAPASPLEKGWGFGGGLVEGSGDTRPRTEFKPLAYFNPGLETDAEGKASVSFDLPDDLTTWRVLAVAVAPESEDTPTAAMAPWRFGNGEATFIAQLPVMVNPLLPQFVRSGDELALGVAVTNTTEQRGRAQIEADLQDFLAFDRFRNRQRQQSRESLEPGTTAFRWPVQVSASGSQREATAETEVSFRVRLGQNQDALTLALPLRNHWVLEQVVETGVSDRPIAIPLVKGQQIDPDVGGLQLNLASTLLPTLVPEIADFPDNPLPFLEPVASRLSIAANLTQLADQGLVTEPVNLDSTVTAALADLADLQQPDGGFSDWPGADQSDPLVTPYAAESLAQAQAAGFSISPELLRPLRGYLDDLLKDPIKHAPCTRITCKTQLLPQLRLDSLIALSALGDTRQDFLYEIVQQEAELDPVSRMRLAQYLARFPNWATEADAIRSELREITNFSSRSARLNVPEQWSWLQAPPVLQAQALQVFAADPNSVDPELAARLLQGLLDLRQAGDWGCSYYNAQALAALVTYSAVEDPQATVAVTARLDRRQILQTQLSPQEPSTTLTVPQADLPRGESELALDPNGDRLHYLAAYRYQAQGQQPGRYQGLRVTRQIRSAGEETILATQGLFGEDSVLEVEAGRVFDIGVEVITDRPIDHLVITDPLPAGFEGVNTRFQTANPSAVAQSDSWELSYEQLYSDRVLAYGQHLEAGVYELHYLVRSVTPGTFSWPGTEATLQYAPEELGRTVSSTLIVKE